MKQHAAWKLLAALVHCLSTNQGMAWGPCGVVGQLLIITMAAAIALLRHWNKKEGCPACALLCATGLHCWLCACWRGAPTGEAAAAPWGSSLWPLICWCETWAAQHMGVFVCECVSGVRQRASSRPAALGLCCRMCGAAWGFSGRCSTRCAWLLATHRQVQLGLCAAVAGQRQAAPRLGLGLLHALACCVIVLLGVNGGLIGSAAWRLACAARLQVCVSANAPAVLVLSFFVDLFLCMLVLSLRRGCGLAYQQWHC